jgi:hypothetical protein
MWRREDPAYYVAVHLLEHVSALTPCRLTLLGPLHLTRHSIICPLLVLFCFITSVEDYSRKQDARYHERYQRAPLADIEKPPPAAPAPQYSPPQTEPVPQLDSQVVSPISSAGGAPQPFVYQGVLYQPVGIAQSPQSYPAPPNELGGEQLKREMAGDQPKGEMPGDGVRAELHTDKT